MNLTSQMQQMVNNFGIKQAWVSADDYHTPHMISVFLCSRILGTLICIWNNGHQYSICCFTIIHTLFHFLIDASGIFGCFLRFVDNLHVDHYWVLYQVLVCDMGYFSITFWGGTSTFLDGYLGSNLQM